jgi:hypothetical protein
MFRKMIKREADEWLERNSGWIGDSNGVVDAGNGMIKVTLNNGNVVEVLNRFAPGRATTPVQIGRSRYLPTVWQVISFRNSFDAPPGGNAIKYHFQQHMYGAEDMVPIHRKQITQLTVFPSPVDGAFYVLLYGDIRLRSGAYIKISTQLRDLSSYVPTTGAVYVVIESDNDGVLSDNVGDPIASPGIASPSDIPIPASGKYPQAIILLYEGQAVLSYDDICVPWPMDFNPVDYSGPGHTHVMSLDDLDDVTVPAPTDGQVLTFDFYSGEWIAADPTGGSGSPGGSDTQLQFNDGGAFGGAKLDYTDFGGTVRVSSERTGDNGDGFELLGADGDNDGNGGGLTFGGGNAPGDGNAGVANIFGGNASGAGDGGDVLFTPGDSTGGAKGRILFRNPGTAETVQLLLNTITANRILTAPDASGVIALYDADIAAIAALSPANDDIIQRKSGVWVARTMAQFALDLDMSTYIAAQTLGASPAIDDAMFYRRDSDGLIRKMEFQDFINNLLLGQLSTVYSGFAHSHNGVDSTRVSHFDLDDEGTNIHSVIDTHLASTSNPHSTTAAQVGAIPIDGWEARSETWTRTGNHTFTVSGDLTAIFRKYTRVQYNDGSVEYGTVLSSSHAAGTTTVNLIPNTSYSMAATTITGKYISYLPKPTGFPDNFTWTPSTIWTVGSGTLTCRFFPRSDGLMEHDIYFEFGSGSSLATSNYTPPAAHAIGSPTGSRMPVALVTYSDVSPATSYAGVALSVPTSSVFGLRVFSIPTTYAIQTAVSGTVPFTWATGDFLSIQGVPYPY